MRVKNYPENFTAISGSLLLNTYEYLRGFNLTYSIRYPVKDVNYEFYHQNKATANWGDKKPTGAQFSLIKTKHFPSTQDHSFMVYSQNKNLTYFSRCLYTPYKEAVDCLENI